MAAARESSPEAWAPARRGERCLYFVAAGQPLGRCNQVPGPWGRDPCLANHCILGRWETTGRVSSLLRLTSAPKKQVFLYEDGSQGGTSALQHTSNTQRGFGSPKLFKKQPSFLGGKQTEMVGEGSTVFNTNCGGGHFFRHIWCIWTKSRAANSLQTRGHSVATPSLCARISPSYSAPFSSPSSSRRLIHLRIFIHTSAHICLCVCVSSHLVLSSSSCVLSSSHLVLPVVIRGSNSDCY